MKKFVDVLLISTLLFVLWACGSGSSNTSPSTAASTNGNGSGSTSGTTGSTGGTTGSTGGTTGSTGGTTGSTGGTTTPTPGSVQSINHVIFLMQENRTFDTYFGMLNPYRQANNFDVGDDGVTYDVDGIDDKLSTFTNEYSGKKFLPFYSPLPAWTT